MVHVNPENPRSSTLAAKLCQDDPDLKCPEHDRMSFLLSDGRAWAALLADAGVVPACVRSCFRKIHLEVPITKGEGPYTTIIGFADASCEVARWTHPEYPMTEGPWRKGLSEEGDTVGFRLFFAEAKPKIVNPMEVLRQINTYREFKRRSFLLWCPTIDDRTRAVFVSQGVWVSSLTVAEVENAIQ